MKKPSMYYWTTDSFNREWRLLVEGEYEEYEDGNNIVADLEVVEYWSEGDIFKEEDVLYEIVAFGESICEARETYIDMVKEYEGGRK